MTVQAAFWLGMASGAFIALGFLGVVLGLSVVAVTGAARRWLKGF